MHWELHLTMKILWLTHRPVLGPRSGGAEVTIVEVGKRLVRRGHDVTVLAGGGRDSAAPMKLSNGIRVIALPTGFLPHVILPLVNRRSIRADVMVDDLAHVVPWASASITGVGNTAFFRHLHRRTLPGQLAGPSARLLTLVERTYPFIYSRTPFVTESNASASDLLALGIASSRIRRIPPGVDCEAFVPQARSPNPQLVYFSGLRPYKRPDHALLALRRVKEVYPGATIVMIGTGPSLGPLEVLAERLQLRSSVSFVGRMARDDLPKVIGASWVNLNSSVAEGWGYSVMEAAACGVPSVAYRVPGVTESIVDQQTGVIASAETPDSLGEGAIEVVRRIREMGPNARQWAERFSWEDSADLWESHLRGVASSVR